MDKLKMQTKDWTEDNYQKLVALFPDIVTESTDINGNVIRAIDKDKLEQEINATVVAGPQQRYEFTWPDKKKAQIAARTSIKKTLRPCREESVNFDTTENLYIEGDNLEVLKLLQETYLGRIKMIYIDPPYNTGHDFVYEDNFTGNREEWLGNSGDYDAEGNLLVDRMTLNTERNGRFHTDWLNMMYPRLRLAKNLLTDDGVIFISIDDNEVENLKKICNEIFGERNFIGQWNWFKSATPPNLSLKIKKNIEYILCYERSRTNVRYKGIMKTSQSSNGLLNQTNKFAVLNFPAGKVEFGLADGVYKKGSYGTDSYEINLLTDLEIKDGVNTCAFDLQAKFKWGQDNLLKEISNGTKIMIRTKTFSPSYEKAEYDPEVPPNFIDESVRVNTTEEAGKALKSLFDGVNVFDYPKPVDLMQYICNFIDLDDSVILDFFSGSATTAHAVMQLNAEDGGKRKFIMVQLPEKCDEKSEAFKAGYKNICEIGKERIRRAGKKIVEDAGDKAKGLDIGFRVLKVDDTNMEDVFYTPNKVEQGDLNMFAENIKSDRTPMDLLFQVMLDLGVELSSKIEVKEVKDKLIYSVNNNYLVACFDDALDDEVITAIAKLQPVYFVTRDSSIATDSVFTNFEQIFMTYSKDTIRKVL